MNIFNVVVCQSRFSTAQNVNDENLTRGAAPEAMSQFWYGSPKHDTRSVWREPWSARISVPSA
jgi:hypothetical protein